MRYALTNRQDCRFARPQAARRAGHKDVPGEHAVSRWHHAHDLRGRRLYCKTRRTGAQAPRPPDALSRCVPPASPDRARIVPKTCAAAAGERGAASPTDRQRVLSLKRNVSSGCSPSTSRPAGNAAGGSGSSPASRRQRSLNGFSCTSAATPSPSIPRIRAARHPSPIG